jgi:hypothetical protein
MMGVEVGNATRLAEPARAYFSTTSNWYPMD